MERTFETEVLTRLAVIESKIDDYKTIKEKADTSYNRSTENEKEICEIKEKLKWISRTIIGAIITGILGIVFVFIKLGIGIK